MPCMHAIRRGFTYRGGLLGGLCAEGAGAWRGGGRGEGRRGDCGVVRVGRVGEWGIENDACVHSFIRPSHSLAWPSCPPNPSHPIPSPSTLTRSRGSLAGGGTSGTKDGVAQGNGELVVLKRVGHFVLVCVWVGEGLCGCGWWGAKRGGSELGGRNTGVTPVRGWTGSSLSP